MKPFGRIFMDKRKKQAFLVAENDLFDDLLAEENSKENSAQDANGLFPEPPEKYEPSAEEDEALDMLDLSNPELSSISSSSNSEKYDDFNLENLKWEANVEAPIKASDDADDLLNCLDEETISNVYHPWRISLYEKLPFICESDKGEQVFLIGYQNGQTAREKETHFHQHETDPIPYVITLDPDPHFISYSFFYGFFRQTLEKLCLKNMAKDDLRIVVKKKIADAFFKKYTFNFRNNPELLLSMREYVETMTENIMESIEKGGENYDGCR